MNEYLEDFLGDPDTFPVTVMLFRDQVHLAKSAELLSMTTSNKMFYNILILDLRIGYQSPEVSKGGQQ